ncbi:toxin-antitoxin system YwqK family antitoxin [Tenacibaculum aiptasiae]|uniref:Toxin-antitoxin system YwqK family antitoxin n=2 Tax=Tenacibaculum aiptasiae TaxID=426481 RepID=A0A7J5A8H4_9FLAO|nr:toxin-antitoxin system YwqK family antitoxin [Tenacibaculum aiptasiae]
MIMWGSEQNHYNLKFLEIMKTSTLIIVMFFGFLTSSITGQETIWFDKNWKETTKENHEFYRPAPKKIKDGFWIIDYYKNGQIQMEGYSTINKPDGEVFDGLVIYYHPNGKPFHKANYKNGKLDGVRKVFYESGELKQQGKYNDGKREGVWKTFYKNGKIETKGKYRDNEKVGVWKTFYKNVY